MARIPSSEPRITENGPLTRALAYTVRSAVSNAACAGDMRSMASQLGAVMICAAISWESP